MKLELDLWYRLPDIYSKLQIDISKHVEKKLGKLKKMQNAHKESPKFRKWN